jgi:hypothetical protein
LSCIPTAAAAAQIEQLEQNVDGPRQLELSDEELSEINRHSDAGADIDLSEQARTSEW